MSDFEFTSKMFEPAVVHAVAERVADIANYKLKMWIERAQTVYGQEHETGCFWSNQKNNRKCFDNYTAKLVNIQPIEKCQHEIEKLSFDGGVVHPADRGKTYGKYKYIYFKCECGQRVQPQAFLPVGDE